MLQLTESMVRASWVTSLFGVERAIGLLGWGGSERPDRRTAKALDVVSEAVFDQLGELTQIAYQTGDELGSEWLELLVEGLSPASWKPEYFRRMAADLGGWSAEAARYVTPDDGGAAAWQELKNKFEIYQLVKAARRKLQLPAFGEPFSLSEFVDKAHGLGSFPAAWAMEGLGRLYTHSVLQARTPDPEGILTAGEFDGLPENSWPMLHAGMGLAFAQDVLADLTVQTPEARIERMLGRFAALCRRNSRPGLEGAALESLGLVTRTWHRRLVPVIDARLMRMESALAAYFWRGVGRAIYFLPINSVPGYGSTWHAVWMSRRESPHEVARENTLAGIVWALTVVNMRTPEIMENLLRSHGRDLEGEPAFVNGVMSSAIMTRATAPDTPYLVEFSEHQVGGRDPGLAKRWRELIRSPILEAVDEYYPVLERSRRIGEVFRVQPLDQLVARLRTRGGR